MASQCIIVSGRDILHPGNVGGEGGKGSGGGHVRGSGPQVILRQVLREEGGEREGEREGEKGERGRERKSGERRGDVNLLTMTVPRKILHKLYHLHATK